MSYDFAFASVYDSFTEEVDYSARAEYIISLLRENSINSGIILDAACGTGSISEHLAEAGYDVIANDISQEMLSIAREKLQKFDNRVLLLCQDMCELDLYGTVDGAVCCLDSLNHLIDEEDFNSAISCISLFMRKNGIFVFDVNTEYKHRCILSENTFVYENDDSFLVWQNSECDEDSVIEMYIDIFSQNSNGSYSRYSDEITERAYSADYICGVLTDNGFEVISIYGDMNKNDPTDDEERIYFVARKK